ncbi:MAG TPA: hypothetical protein VGK51_06715 [Actinomycetota bacterium]
MPSRVVPRGATGTDVQRSVSGRSGRLNWTSDATGMSNPAAPRVPIALRSVLAVGQSRLPIVTPSRGLVALP